MGGCAETRGSDEVDSGAQKVDEGEGGNGERKPPPRRRNRRSRGRIRD
jgi:hypothetical protein